MFFIKNEDSGVFENFVEKLYEKLEVRVSKDYFGFWGNIIFRGVVGKIRE